MVFDAPDFFQLLLLCRPYLLFIVLWYIIFLPKREKIDDYHSSLYSHCPQLPPEHSQIKSVRFLLRINLFP